MSYPIIVSQLSFNFLCLLLLYSIYLNGAATIHVCPRAHFTVSGRFSSASDCDASVNIRFTADFAASGRICSTADGAATVPVCPWAHFAASGLFSSTVDCAASGRVWFTAALLAAPRRAYSIVACSALEPAFSTAVCAVPGCICVSVHWSSLYCPTRFLQQLVLQLEVFVQRQSVLCQEMSGIEQLHLYMYMSLNRSQCGSCFTKYDTSAGT